MIFAFCSRQRTSTPPLHTTIIVVRRSKTQCRDLSALFRSGESGPSVTIGWHGTASPSRALPRGSAPRQCADWPRRALRHSLDGALSIARGGAMKRNHVLENESRGEFGAPTPHQAGLQGHR